MLLLELGLFEMVSAPAKDEYRCLVCGDRMKSRKSVERHVLGHYLEEPLIESVLGKDEDENDEDEVMSIFMGHLKDQMNT